MKKKYLIIFIFIVFLIALQSFGPAKRAVNGFVLQSTQGMSAKTSAMGKKTKHFFSFFTEISNYRKQNAELAGKLSALEVDQSKITELEYENDLLKKELGYIQGNKDYSLIPSKIIGRDPTNYLDEITIDTGKNEGVAPGMAVLSGGALAGQVKEVYDDQSKVTLITSKDSVILAMLQTSRSKGILRGGISGLLLEDITHDVQFEPNEFIVTSGLDGQLREGILIGRAGKISNSSSDLFKNISVEPVVDVSKLEIVFVLK
jgi:rod shape-determining protein MreC